MLTFGDFLTAADHDQMWSEMERDGLTNINSSIIFDTEEMGTFEVPVKAEVKRPRLIHEETMVFDTLQVGETQWQDLYLENPTNESIQLQLFLTYDLEHEVMKMAEEDADRIDSF